jgi:hypothetical protein
VVVYGDPGHQCILTRSHTNFMDDEISNEAQCTEELTAFFKVLIRILSSLLFNLRMSLRKSQFQCMR